MKRHVSGEALAAGGYTQGAESIASVHTGG
jgi:hypothetical protein